MGAEPAATAGAVDAPKASKQAAPSERLKLSNYLGILRDDPESGPDCLLGSKYIDDYAAETRPVNYCDRGADEFHP